MRMCLLSVRLRFKQLCIVSICFYKAKSYRFSKDVFNHIGSSICKSDGPRRRNT
ncbi:AAEL003880-PA [Aedes aegypti]|uniref:AAEL003880-PA n=1 Tax=Aedes aegypti TaxID=7159 RepID=Q17E93_AEDAE|nr:AAEL003880-PA [Aedes aegypti]